MSVSNIERIRKKSDSLSCANVDWTINRVRLFNDVSEGSDDSEGNSYFIDDTGVRKWKLGPQGTRRCEWRHLADEVKSGGQMRGKDKVIDVVRARDGAWIVLRPTRFKVSPTVSSALESALKSFCVRHQQRRQAQAADVRAYDEVEKQRIIESDRIFAIAEGKRKQKEMEERMRARKGAG
jgi:hypothetical protein